MATLLSTTVTGSLDVNGVAAPAFPFTFGGTGTPTTGTDKTPWLRVPAASNCVSASLSAKTAPTGGSFVVSIYKSTDGGSTFPTNLATLTMTTGNKIATNTAILGNTVASGDLLRLDITSVNSAADWTCQLYTKL
jgi:hypothetical protein